MMKYIALLLIFLFPAHLFAATYYVATTGSNDTGDGSIGNPWGTPVYGAAQLTSGDTLYIRAGTYNITTSADGMSSAINPGGISNQISNTTIAGYPGETVILKGDGGDGAGVSPTGGVIGSWYDTGLTMQNLTVEGVVVMQGTGITLKNSDLSVGGDRWDGTFQGEVIWLYNCTNCLIQNNRLHDNVTNDYYGFLPINDSLIMEYQSHTCTIENNDIYNSAGGGINLKDTPSGHIVRYNHIYDNDYSGIWTAQQVTADGSSIYQNIIRNNNTSQDPEHGGISVVTYATGILIYNNTFYNNYVADLMQWTSGTTTSYQFYNNISYVPRAAHISMPYSSAGYSATYMDYNDYYNDVTWQYKSNTYTTLANWQTGCGALLADCDANSITTDPGFLNGSGNLNVPADFKRASYTANGRGGDYPSVMGAYITGSETIGYTSGGSDTTAPSTTISTSDPSAITNGSLTVEGTASDAVGVSGCKWRLSAAPDASNGTACTGTTSFSCATSGYASGANTIYVGCYDAAGNYGSDSITVNYTVPTTTVSDMTFLGSFLWQ